MTGALFIFKNAVNDSIALFGKDLTAVDASAGAVTLYFNSQDASGVDVNSVALAVTAGKENDVVQLIGEIARSERTVLFDDEVAGNDFPSADITGITSITLNGIPAGGVFAQQNVINVSTASRTLTDAEAGSLIVIDADGCAITMPESDAAAVGQVYDFVVGTSQTSTNVITVTLGGSDVYKGALHIVSAGGDDTFASDGSDTIVTLNATTKGGLEGGSFRLTFGEAGKVYITGTVLGSGTVATMFS